MSLLKLTGESEVSIYLHLEPEGTQANLAQTVLWRGNGFHIYRFRARQVKVPAMAIELPDAEAEKAVRWDKAHQERLTKSPAFLATIENKTLCQKCF